MQVLSFFYAHTSRLRDGLWLTYGDPAGPSVLSQLADRITESIRLENKEIDPDKIETELETQDRVAIMFYGGADLSHDAVVVATSKR